VTDVEASNFNGVVQITIGVSVQMNGFPNARNTLDVKIEKIIGSRFFSPMCAAGS
jgi:hypothetical protein